MLVQRGQPRLDRVPFGGGMLDLELFTQRRELSLSALRRGARPQSSYGLERISEPVRLRRQGPGNEHIDR